MILCGILRSGTDTPKINVWDPDHYRAPRRKTREFWAAFADPERELASYITGAELVIDGGYSTQ